MTMKRLLIIEPSWFTLRHGLYGQMRFLTDSGFQLAIASEDDPRARAVANEVGALFFPIDIDRFRSLRRDISALLTLAAMFRQFRPSVLQCSTKKAGFLGGIVGRLYRVPVIYLVRGLIRAGVTARSTSVFQSVERINAALAAKVITISRSNLRHFLENHLCKESKLLMFGSGSLEGADTERFKRTEITRLEGDALRRKLDIPADAFVIGFVGRLVLEKGIRELALAWQRVRIVDEKLHLLIVSPPEVGSGAESWVEDLNSDPRVHFTGFLPDPVSAYAAMNCFVLPSYSEGFPNVLIEAACFELPVIATRVSGCVDAVIEGETGWLVEPRDEAALGEAIARAFNEPDSARTLGRNARRRAVTHFRQEMIWESYAELYTRLSKVGQTATTLPLDHNLHENTQ
jgi:glycosyltransferase involved in cell wall biosynthesis